MNKFLSRSIALLILLVIPLLFFFYYKQKVDALPHRADALPIYWPAPSFSFETHGGGTLSGDSLSGSIYVANFIFTSCQSVCPALSQTMAQIQQNFIQKENIKLVSFSIDPDRDSIPVLKEYAASYGAKPGKWYFLRGERQTVWDMAQTGFKIPVVYTPEGGAGNEFTHSERIVLVDAEGNIRGFYNGLDRADVDSLYNDLAALLVSSNP
jgi:protein SCO1/2